MKSNFTRAALLALLSLAGGAELMAQRFTNNTGGTYNADCSGVIRLKSTTPALVAGGTYFNGSAPLGTSTSVINGIVDYNRTSATSPNIQEVQGLYYSLLYLQGNSSKNVVDGVHIMGAGCLPPASLGYTNLTASVPYFAEGGSRNYSGTFYYAAVSGTQNIFRENGATSGSDRYAGLTLTGGATANKTTTGAGDIIVEGAFTLAASTPLALGGTSTLNLANTTTNVSSIAGDLTVGAGSKLNVTGTAAHVNVPGSLTLDVGGTGTLNLDPNTYLDISGSLSNTFPAKTNMTFDPTSTVAYTGTSAQTIVNTVNTNKYGNLVFSGAGAKTVGGDIYAKGNVAFGDGTAPTAPVTLDMGANVFDVDVTGKTSSPISYTSPNNNQYISGKVNLSGTLVNTIDYVMNNAQTQVHFSAVPTTFALDIVPATTPVNVQNFNGITDAKRKIIVGYTGTSGVLSELKIGYSSADIASPFAGTESRFRMVEGYSSSADAQKITGGLGIATNSNGADPRFVSLGGSIVLNNQTSGGNVSELGNGSSIILTTVPNTFISIASGRWTNKNTWDEGSLPTSSDNVEIRHLVYAGIASNSTASAFGTTQGTAVNRINMIPESESYPTGAVANSILIGNYTGASLVVGNEDNGLNFNFHTVTTPGATSAGVLAGLVNSNVNPSANITDKSLTSGINGLYITNLGSNPSIFGTAVITNNGAVNNKGIIEIGE